MHGNSVGVEGSATILAGWTCYFEVASSMIIIMLSTVCWSVCSYEVHGRVLDVRTFVVGYPGGSVTSFNQVAEGVFLGSVPPPKVAESADILIDSLCGLYNTNVHGDTRTY